MARPRKKSNDWIAEKALLFVTALGTYSWPKKRTDLAEKVLRETYAAGRDSILAMLREPDFAGKVFNIFYADICIAERLSRLADAIEARTRETK